MLIKNIHAVINKSDNGSSFDVVTIKRRFLRYNMVYNHPVFDRSCEDILQVQERAAY